MSTGSDISTDIAVGKYWKFFNELGKIESYGLCKSQKILNINKNILRKELILILLREKPDFRTNWSTKKFYFEAYEAEDGKFKLKTCKEADIKIDEFVQRKGQGAKIKIGEIIKCLEENNDEEDGEDVVLDKTQYEDASENVPENASENVPLKEFMLEFQKDRELNTSIQTKLLENIVKNSSKNSSNYNGGTRYIRYHEDEGLGLFIQKLETYFTSKNMDDDQTKVSMAIECLNYSDGGQSKMNFCNGVDLCTWANFRLKLMGMESINNEMFENKFNSYKRKHGETAYQLMGNLCEFFKKGRNFPKDHKFTEDQKYNICSRFRNCLDPELANHLKQALADAKRRGELINEPDFVANLCMELEINYELGYHAKKSKVNNMGFATESELINKISAKLEETILNNLKRTEAKMNNLENKFNNSNKNFQKFKKGENSAKSKHSDAEGYCIFYTNFGNCRAEKYGKSCFFKHDKNPPQNVKDYITKIFAKSK